MILSILYVLFYALAGVLIILTAVYRIVKKKREKRRT